MWGWGNKLHDGEWKDKKRSIGNGAMEVVYSTWRLSMIPSTRPASEVCSPTPIIYMISLLSFYLTKYLKNSALALIFIMYVKNSNQRLNLYGKFKCFYFGIHVQQKKCKES